MFRTPLELIYQFNRLNNHNFILILLKISLVWILDFKSYSKVILIESNFINKVDLRYKEFQWEFNENKATVCWASYEWKVR
jgi:hypothetical protein